MRTTKTIVGLVVTLGALTGTGVPARAQTKPCSLLSPAELEAALGGKAGPAAEAKLGHGQACNLTVGSAKVMIRVAPRAAGENPDMERKGVEAARKMGIQVDVETEGDLSCSRMVPPATMAQVGYNTTCTIFREGVVVGVEVTASSQKEMAATKTVKELVQKARSRM